MYANLYCNFNLFMSKILFMFSMQYKKEEQEKKKLKE